MIRKEVLSVGTFAVNCVLLWDDASPCDASGNRLAWVFDPGADAQVILSRCKKLSLVPSEIFLTHGHFDHVSAIASLLGAYPTLRVHIAAEDAVMFGNAQNCWVPDYDVPPRPATLMTDLTEGASFALGAMSLRVLKTPGHSRGSVSFHVAPAKLLLSGDTLFAGSAGRTDFPGGDAHALSLSLARLASLPTETLVIAGHGPETTIARERATNPFMPR